MSHVRISTDFQYGPLIPPRSADLVIALEPSEAARVLAQFGNPQTITVVNSRPMHPVDVISGHLAYPDLSRLFEKIRSLSSKTYFLKATEKALELGNPILANIILIGAVAGLDILPISEEALAQAITDYMSQDKVEINLRAFRMGKEMVKQRNG